MPDEQPGPASRSALHAPCSLHTPRPWSSGTCLVILKLGRNGPAPTRVVLRFRDAVDLFDRLRADANTCTNTTAMQFEEVTKG